MLFGVTECGCGYKQAEEAESLPFELSYWEALRAYWRVYWPSQLFAAAAVVALTIIAGVFGIGRAFLSQRDAVNLFAIAASSIGLYLFVGRIISRPYRHFSIEALWTASEATTGSLPPSKRIQVWWFLLWRQSVGAWLAGMLSVPINGLVSMFGFVLPTFIITLAGVLVIGPVLLRMLIGHQFAEFRLEARRPGQTI